MKTLDELITEEIRSEYVALRVAHVTETNTAAATQPRSFITLDDTLEIGAHCRNTTYTPSDMEANNWAEEVTGEMNRLTDDDLAEALREAECDDTPPEEEATDADAYRNGWLKRWMELTDDRDMEAAAQYEAGTYDVANRETLTREQGAADAEQLLRITNHNPAKD